MDATLLESGEVLITGGAVGAFCLCCCGPDSSSISVASAELYDPQTELWRYTGSLNTVRRSHTATLLEDGQVLVTGGYADVSQAFPLKSAEIYDPATGGCRPTESFNTIQGAHSTTLLDASPRSGRQPVAQGESASPGWQRSGDTSPRSGRQHVAQGESASPG